MMVCGGRIQTIPETTDMYSHLLNGRGDSKRTDSIFLVAQKNEKKLQKVSGIV